MRWSGTPALIAKVAATAQRVAAINEDGHAELRIKVEAPAWEGEYFDADDFAGSLDAADLPDIETLTIRAFIEDRRITVTFVRPPRRRAQGEPEPPVVSLHVAGSDRHWVNDTTDAMSQEIRAGVPQSAKVFYRMMLASLVVLAAGLALLLSGSATDVGGLVTTGWVVLVTGVGLLLLSVLPGSVLPRLEILPEGRRPRRSQVLRWGRQEGGWLIRLLIAALVGSGVTLFIQWLA